MQLSQHLVLSQRQNQQLILTPKMQQAIEMLQLTTMELEQYLEEQLVTNPVLEEDTASPEEEVPTPESEKENELTEGDILEEFAHVLNDDFSGSGFERGGHNPDANGEDSKRRFLENTAAIEESLQENLERQLQMVTTDTRAMLLGNWIISGIDERGYFIGSLADGADQFGVPLHEMENALALIQTLSPAGIGARNARECILIQVQQRDPNNALLHALVANHFEELGKKQYSQIAQALHCTVEQVQQMADELKAGYEPYPGRELASDPVHYVTPDARIEKRDGEYAVLVNDDGMPRLRISPYYRKLLKQANNSKETKEYIRDKLRSAQWLVKNIQQRKDTIRKVTEEIVDVQRAFLDHGIEHLRPLTLREIADRIGMHESTVSRVTSNKYVETPRGVMPYKFFFSSGIDSGGGESVASKTVKDQIRRMIEAEDKNKPLSDQKITNTLNDTGVNIARRTVAKYREELNILPSKYRREYSKK